jgi:D-3-phosphoglycerate dehydrogenase
MFGESQFRLMKRSALFISTARGGIHDERALYAALVDGVIAGAGLDVFSIEPPSPEHPLLQLENVVATHHVAGLSADALRSMAVYAATQWQDSLSGKVPPRLVNPEAWDAYSRRFAEAFGQVPDPLR